MGDIYCSAQCTLAGVDQGVPGQTVLIDLSRKLVLPDDKGVLWEFKLTQQLIRLAPAGDNFWNTSRPRHPADRAAANLERTVNHRRAPSCEACEDHGWYGQPRLESLR
jgi:hypothetical protein